MSGGATKVSGFPWGRGLGRNPSSSPPWWIHCCLLQLHHWWVRLQKRVYSPTKANTTSHHLHWLSHAFLLKNSECSEHFSTKLSVDKGEVLQRHLIKSRMSSPAGLCQWTRSLAFDPGVAGHSSWAGSQIRWQTNRQIWAGRKLS